MSYEANFFGKSGFYWWIGCVEDRRDPQLLGRVKVRVLGAHTEDKTLIPTTDLQWAYIYQSPDNAAMNGLGWSAVGLVEGTWVFGFYRDGESAQDPVVTGSIPGIPQQAPLPCIGFNDAGTPYHDVANAPRKIRSRYYPNDGTGAQLINESQASLYPRATNPWSNIIGESDTNRLARGQLLTDTIIGVQQRQRDVHVPIAFVHPTPVRQWNEPASPANPKYPYNKVFEDESGNIVEFDSTPGNERIHVYHRTGTRIEIDALGNFSIKVVGERFDVTMENSYSHFQNTMNLTVDGECNIYCRSNANLQVDGNLTVDVGGDYIEHVKGNYTTDITGNRMVRVGGSDQRNSEGAMSDISGGSIVQSAGSSFMMASGGTLSGDAPAIHWNSSIGSTQSPSPPVVPPFPAPLDDWVETRNETFQDPVLEQKPDTNPISCPGQPTD